jgi:hypothetical protein
MAQYNDIVHNYKPSGVGTDPKDFKPKVDVR